MPLPYGVGMSLSKIVPFVKTVSMRVVLNVKQIKPTRDNHAWYHGVHVTTHTILTASVDGPVKRKTPVPYVKKPGQQSKQPNSDSLINQTH